jgi:hypothetical protein
MAEPSKAGMRVFSGLWILLELTGFPISIVLHSFHQFIQPHSSPDLQLITFPTLCHAKRPQPYPAIGLFTVYQLSSILASMVTCKDKMLPSSLDRRSLRRRHLPTTEIPYD